MDRNRLARGVLLVDGVGCLAAAGALVGDDRVGDLIHPARFWRLPTAGALAATSTVLLLGALSSEASPATLRRAAIVNAGWVAACLATLTRPLPPTGRALVATTAVLDGAVGAVQWNLQR